MLFFRYLFDISVFTNESLFASLRILVCGPSNTCSCGELSLYKDSNNL